MVDKTQIAKVLADSKFGNTRLISLEVEMHRFILAENNTHKMQSRNIQSSRAVPVLRMLEQISNNPALPYYYGKEQSGMVADEELTPDEIEKCKEIILQMRDACLEGVKQLKELKLHKEISNRYIEPWMWTKGVVTATESAWKAMFALRCHYAAQPEIRVLFEAIEEAISNSTPTEMLEGELHVPYVTKKYEGGNVHYYSTEGELLTKHEAIKISASCCAQVSYRRLDDSLEKALKVYDMLNLPVNGVYPDEPPHYSPSEHLAIAHKTEKELSGNFHSEDFIQYRKLLEKGLEGEYVE